MMEKFRKCGNCLWFEESGNDQIDVLGNCIGAMAYSQSLLPQSITFDTKSVHKEGSAVNCPRWTNEKILLEQLGKKYGFQVGDLDD